MFSITTTASSTKIPNAIIKEKREDRFNVNPKAHAQNSVIASVKTTTNKVIAASRQPSERYIRITIETVTKTIFSNSKSVLSSAITPISRVTRISTLLGITRPRIASPLSNTPDTTMLTFSPDCFDTSKVTAGTGSLTPDCVFSAYHVYCFAGAGPSRIVATCRRKMGAPF